jgi:hypothetical protein
MNYLPQLRSRYQLVAVVFFVFDFVTYPYVEIGYESQGVTIKNFFLETLMLTLLLVLFVSAYPIVQLGRGHR